MSRAFFATSADYPELTSDDLLAADALRALGIAVEPAVWSATPPASLEGAAVVVIRSCWDYHLRPAEFVEWVGSLERRGVTVVNGPGLVRWNLHKRYLLELAREDVAVVPTRLVEQGSSTPLESVLAERGWEEAVVKPAVSLSAYETWRAAADEARASEPRFRALVGRGDVLVQAFVPEIESAGEWSLVFLDGRYSHAVRKRPRTGDFRVQIDHGGTVAPETPPEALITDAARAVGALPETPLYARVDGVEVQRRLVLMELECIDPVLFFAAAPGSADRFAARVAARIGAPPRA